MAISQGGKKGQIFSEINITPLTDIFLVLLIIMMVIAPMFDNTNKDIKVPSLTTGHSIDDNKVTVEITKDGQFYVKGTKISEQNLTDELRKQMQETQQKSLVLRADKTTHSSEVLKVYEAASTAGYEKLTVAGEPLSDSRQQKLESQETK